MCNLKLGKIRMLTQYSVSTFALKSLHKRKVEKLHAPFFFSYDPPSEQSDETRRLAAEVGLGRSRTATACESRSSPTSSPESSPCRCHPTAPRHRRAAAYGRQVAAACGTRPRHVFGLSKAGSSALITSRQVALLHALGLAARHLACACLSVRATRALDAARGVAFACIAAMADAAVRIVAEDFPSQVHPTKSTITTKNAPIPRRT